MSRWLDRLRGWWRPAAARAASMPSSASAAAMPGTGMPSAAASRPALEERTTQPADVRGCPWPAGSIVELQAWPVASWRLGHPEAYAREGFAGNPVAYRCITMIARAVAAVPLKSAPPPAVRRAAVEEAAAAVLGLLRRPNELQCGRELIEALVAHLLISGNAWLKVTLDADGRPLALHGLNPQRVRIVRDRDGWPVAWDYEAEGRCIRLRQRPADPVPPVMQLRLFSPFSDLEGLSPFAACARAVDIHNAAATWSKALLDNAARPSGALVFRGEGGLTREQYERLKSELEQAHAGPANAGRPLVLEGGLEWKPLSHSPRDMEHIELRHVAAREIALAFGVPPMLLGIPGDNTYANYAEANRVFWRATVLPLARRLADHLSAWLAPAWDLDDLWLEPDTDALEAYAPDREALWRRLKNADFLTRDEKRAAVGYPPLDGGDARA